MWPSFARMIGRPDLVGDPRFRTPEDRAEHHGELAPIIQGWFDSRTRAEVFAAAQEAGLPGAPVLTVGEVMEDGHFAHRGYFVDIDHPVVGTVKYPGAPFLMNGTPWQASGPAPTLGQHNLQVLGQQLGYSADELVRLRAMEVI